MATFATNVISCSAENVKVLSWGYGEPSFGVELRHMSFDCPPHVV